MEPDAVVNAALRGLLVGEGDLVFRDRHAVDAAPESLVGHEARRAAARSGVEQQIVGRDVTQMVEQEVGLGRLQAMQLGEDAVVPGLIRAFERGEVDGPTP